MSLSGDNKCHFYLPGHKLDRTTTYTLVCMLVLLLASSVFAIYTPKENEPDYNTATEIVSCISMVSVLIGLWMVQSCNEKSVIRILILIIVMLTTIAGLNLYKANHGYDDESDVILASQVAGVLGCTGVVFIIILLGMLKKS